MSKASFNDIMAYVKDHWVILVALTGLTLGVISDRIQVQTDLTYLRADVRTLKENEPRLYVVEGKIDALNSAISNIAVDVREIRANQNVRGK